MNDERRFAREVQQYAQRGDQGSLETTFSRYLPGAIAKLLSGMMGRLFGGRNLLSETERAIKLLRESGYDVVPADPTALHEPPIQDYEPSSVPPVRQVPTVGSGRQQGGRQDDEWPEERSIASPVRVLPSGFDQPSGRDVGVDLEWQQTPESSNVYAFGYDNDNGILYITFKANGPAQFYTRQQSKPSISSSGNERAGGSYWMGHRAHVAGATYAYGSRKSPIPRSVFLAMKSLPSKGGFVWDRLRIRGTISGHRVPYTLAAVPDEGDNTYVPRKAARNSQGQEGFRVRAVPMVGTGRRGYRRSTLPPTI